MQIRFIVRLSNEQLHLIRWMPIREQKDEAQNTPYYQSAENVRLSTASESCHNHHCDNDCGVKAALQIQTLQNSQKGWSEAAQWRAGTWTDHDSDGGDDDESGTAITTEWEWSCSGNKNKKEPDEVWVLHGDVSSQVLMRSKLDKASRSAQKVLNTAMWNAIMIVMVW